MKRFKSSEHAQRFLEVHGIVATTFDRNDIYFLLRTIEPKGSVDSKRGTRSSQPEIPSSADSLIASS
jgi:hypothetical protein